MRIDPSRRVQALTLTELLCVVLLVALLAALLFPVFASNGQRARTAVCASNMRQIVTAILQYSADHNGALPPVWETPYTRESSWSSLLGVYFGKSVSNVPGTQHQQVGRDYLQCPTQRAVSKSNGEDEKLTYGVIYSGGPTFTPKPLFALRQESGKLANFRPNTLLVGESQSGFIYSPSTWKLNSDDGTSSKKHPKPYNQAKFPHNDCMTSGFADGSVRLMTLEEWKNGAAELKLQ